MTTSDYRPRTHATMLPAPVELVIAGCCKEKATTSTPLPALDLYDGGCVPQLRARVGGEPGRRSRVRFLSAEHGLVTADTPLHPYDRPLDATRATTLRPHVWTQLQHDLGAGAPPDVLVIAEPLYLVLLADLLAHPARPRIHWIADHANGWPEAAALLDAWGW